MVHPVCGSTWEVIVPWPRARIFPRLCGRLSFQSVVCGCVSLRYSTPELDSLMRLCVARLCKHSERRSSMRRQPFVWSSESAKAKRVLCKLPEHGAKAVSAVRLESRCFEAFLCVTH